MIQPVVKRVVKPVWQPVVSCKRGFRRQWAASLEHMVLPISSEQVPTVIITWRGRLSNQPGQSSSVHSRIMFSAVLFLHAVNSYRLWRTRQTLFSASEINLEARTLNN